MFLKELMNFHPSLETQELPNFRFRHLFRAVAFPRECFQGRARWLPPRRDDLGGKIVRGIEGNFHTLRITPVQNAIILSMPCIATSNGVRSGLCSRCEAKPTVAPLPSRDVRILVWGLGTGFGCQTGF